MVHKVRKDSVLAVYINICVNGEVLTFKDLFIYLFAQETEETPI